MTGGGAFPVTAWSMLHQAQGEVPAESLAGWERLARAYWQPLYVFLRRRGADHHTAGDGAGWGFGGVPADCAGDTDDDGLQAD